jgi:signal peptidase I
MANKSVKLLRAMWDGWLKPVGVAVGVVVMIRSAVADWNDVPSQSMEPTILIGDRIFVNKLAYDLKVPFTTRHLAKWSDPLAGDVVVFFSPTDGKRMVKRVVGLPGQVIELRNNQLFIDGQRLNYLPMQLPTEIASDLADPTPIVATSENLGGNPHAVIAQPQRPAMRSFGPLVVPPDCYFVMGDNRDNSGDSRAFGCVPRDRIVGKAVGLAFSLDHTHSYSPRWSRFFRGL